MKAPAKQLPPEVLKELRKCGIPPDAYEVFLAGSGVSGTSKKLELVRRLYTARQQYMQRKVHEKTKLPNTVKQYRQLDNISKTASRLLKHLGIEDPLSVATTPFLSGMGVAPIVTVRLLPELQKVSSERRLTATKMDAITRLKSLLFLLSDLTEAGDRLSRNVARQIKSKRGGVLRKGNTAETALIENLIVIYVALNPLPRGSTRSLDKTLETFIRAGIDCATAHQGFRTVESGEQYEPYIEALALDKTLARRTTHAAIRSVFSRWNVRRPKQIPE